MIIDAQVHVVSRDTDAYPLDPAPMDVPRWFERHARTAQQLMAEMDAAGVNRAVLVQGFSVYRYDNRYTADAAAARPDRFASSCIVDVHDDPVRAMGHWVADRGARAIRLFLQTTSDDWLDSPECDTVLGEFARLGAIAQLAIAPHQLDAARRAAQRHPDVMFLVDHCGFPDFSGGDRYPNAAALFALAAAANIHVKLSAHVLGLATAAGADPATVTARIVEAFDAHRVMWASDLTVHDRAYVDLLDDARHACHLLPPEDRNLVLGAAAAALWWP